MGTIRLSVDALFAPQTQSSIATIRKELAKVGPCELVVDPTLPAGTVHLEQEGKVVCRIVNLSPEIGAGGDLSLFGQIFGPR